MIINQQCGTPFDPLKTVGLFAATAKPYRIGTVTVDRFAHNTFQAAFAQHGISAVLSELTTHQTYEAFGPRLNSGQIVLLDNADLQNQFLGLLWRGMRIDHANNEHDDYAAVVARLASVLGGDSFDAEEFLRMNQFTPERTVNAGVGWLDQGAPTDDVHVLIDRSRSGRGFWDL